MSMSKDQTVAVVSGAVFGVAVLALGYFLFDAASARAEAEETLNDETAKFQRYNAAAVFPSKASIAGTKENAAALAAWREGARFVAARGGVTIAPESPTVFKQRLQETVKKLLEFPGGKDGKIAAPTFLFGFEQYLGETGVLPASADVPRLAAQLDFITHVVETGVDAGLSEVRDVKRLEAPNTEESEDEGRAHRKKAKNRNKAKGKESAKAEKAEREPTRLDYAFSVRAKPAAFVKFLNALTADLRFVTIEKFAFREPPENMIDARFHAADEAQNKAASGGRRGRRRGAAVEAAAPVEDARKDNRLVVDPELEAPVIVDFTLSVLDFGKGEE